MTTQYYPFTYSYKDKFNKLEVIGKFEGSIIYVGIKEGKYKLIIDSGRLVDMFEYNDPMFNRLIQINIFETETELTFT